LDKIILIRKQSLQHGHIHLPSPDLYILSRLNLELVQGLIASSVHLLAKFVE